MYSTKHKNTNVLLQWIVCVDFYGPVNPRGSCRAQSVYLTTLFPANTQCSNNVVTTSWRCSDVVTTLCVCCVTVQAKSSERLTSIVHILSPEAYNCASWISGRDRMTIEKKIVIILHERMLQTRRGRTRNLLITSRMRIQLSHLGNAMQQWSSITRQACDIVIKLSLRIIW